MAKEPAPKPSTRRSPPISLKPLSVEQVVEGLLATPPAPKKPAAKKAPAKKKSRRK